MREVVDPSGFSRDDPPEIEILWEKVRTGHLCGGDGFVREAGSPAVRK